MSTFWTQYWDVIGFYVLVVLLLYIFRSKFEFQGIVALFRTKLGLQFMTETGSKHAKFWDKLGYFSIFLCFVGMAVIMYFLGRGLWDLFFDPSAPPTLTPVLPGVKIPGSPITFPLWYTLIGLFLAVVVHEGAHGVWAAAHGLKIKSSGLAMFGPLPGAFVEPDEKEMEKRPAREQLAIYGAGPFSNAVLAAVCYLAMFGLVAAADSVVTEEGAFYGALLPDGAAENAGMPASAIITVFDTTQINSIANLTAALATHKPGDQVLVGTDQGNFKVTLKESPDDANVAYLGVIQVKTATQPKNPTLGWVYTLLLLFVNVAFWTFVISLGLGLANLLPIGPVDGGRMFLIALTSFMGEKKAKSFWVKWSYALFVVVILLVFVPIIRAVVG